MGGGEKYEGEDGDEQERGEDREGVGGCVAEQVSEACFGVRFKKATPEGEGTSRGGVDEEEGYDEVSCFKQEGECGCSDC